MGVANDLAPGAALPNLEVGPISRLDLALYCGASGDHNPMHVDIDFARAHGHDDVFVHGMLSMAYLGRLLTDAFEPGSVRSFSARFLAIVHVGEVLQCSGRVAEISTDSDGARLARLEIVAVSTAGVKALEGEAVVALQR